MRLFICGSAMRTMKRFHSILFISLLTTFSMAGDLVSSFKQAAELADVQERDPATQTYLKRDLTPYYEHNYSPVFSVLLRVD